MSRIGRLHIAVPAGVTVEYNNQVVTVKGPKGTLTQHIDSKNINVEIDGAEVKVTRSNEEKETKAMHGLYRMLIANMVAWAVVTPFSKDASLSRACRLQGFRCRQLSIIHELRSFCIPLITLFRKELPYLSGRKYHSGFRHKQGARRSGCGDD